jgi:hypothetical protein
MTTETKGEGTMTAEERAELAAAESFPVALLKPYPDVRERMVREIAKAVRSAEEAAYERAAREVDESLFEGLAEGGIDGPASIGHIRDFIRSLASPSAKGDGR